MPDGSLTRAHLEAAARKRHPNPAAVAALAALDTGQSPGPLAYLWHWFLELHNRRGKGAMGPDALTWPDFDAWARRMRRDPEPWEFAVLTQLDNVFAAVHAPKAEPA